MHGNGCWLFPLGCCCPCRPAQAQQGTADVRGKVVDQQGGVLPGVTVIVRHQESGLYREAVTGTDGLFLMSAMTPGVYEVSAELSGFKKYMRRDIVVAVGATAQVEVKLEVGGVAETVTVTGESPLVDTTSNEIGGRITAQEFVDTPSFNRNFAGYLGMLPGVVASISATTFGADSISVAGQNVRNVNYTMDGSNNNDTFNGGNGGAQARVPVEAVQEFQLLTSQFDAEFGLASGGVVNSVSKSGTNQYHGSAFFFHQDQNLAAVDYFAKKADLEESDSKQQQWGGTIGGPIVRDKAHYFFSLERIALDTAVTTNIPSRPDLARTDFEISRVWNTFLRADHQLTPSNTYGIRWLRETSPQPLQIQAENHTPPRHEAETDVDWTVVGNLSSVIGSTRVNTFRVSAVSEDVFFGNPNFNTQRSRSEDPAAAAELPEFPGSAERAGQPAARRGVRRRRRVRLVRPRQGRRSRSQVRHQLSVFVTAQSGLRQPERHIHDQQRPAVRSQQPANLSRAADGPCADRLGLLHEGTLHRDVRAGQMEVEQRLHCQLRRALRHRAPANAERRQPVVHRRCQRLSRQT